MTPDERADLQSAIAVTVRKERMMAGISQEELGARIGWSKGNICNLEAGRTGVPSVATLVSVADAIGIDAGALLSEALVTARGVNRLRREEE